MSEIGASIKEAYRVLEIIPTLKVSETIKQMADLSPVVSAVQSLPMVEIQRNLNAIHAELPSPAVMQAASQAAQMTRHIWPQYEALQQIIRMSNLVSAVKPPALFTSIPTHLSEVEEEQPDAESEQGNEDKDTMHEAKDNIDDTDGRTE